MIASAGGLYSFGKQQYATAVFHNVLDVQHRSEIGSVQLLGYCSYHAKQCKYVLAEEVVVSNHNVESCFAHSVCHVYEVVSGCVLSKKYHGFVFKLLDVEVVQVVYVVFLGNNPENHSQYSVQQFVWLVRSLGRQLLF